VYSQVRIAASVPEHRAAGRDRQRRRRNIGDFGIRRHDHDRRIVRPSALQGLLEIVIGHAEGDLAGDIAVRIFVDQHQIRHLAIRPNLRADHRLGVGGQTGGCLADCLEDRIHRRLAERGLVDFGQLDAVRRLQDGHEERSF
jgi:hypothetical protein